MVFQHFNLFPHMTVLENPCLAQRVVRKRGKAEREAKTRALLAKVGIGQKADEYPLAPVRRPAAARGDRSRVVHGPLR